MEGNELLLVSLLTFVGVLAVGAAVLITRGERRQRIEAPILVVRTMNIGRPNVG